MVVDRSAFQVRSIALASFRKVVASSGFANDSGSSHSKRSSGSRFQVSEFCQRLTCQAISVSRRRRTGRAPRWELTVEPQPSQPLVQMGNEHRILYRRLEGTRSLATAYRHLDDRLRADVSNEFRARFLDQPAFPLPSTGAYALEVLKPA